MLWFFLVYAVYKFKNGTENKNIDIIQKCWRAIIDITIAYDLTICYILEVIEESNKWSLPNNANKELSWVTLTFFREKRSLFFKIWVVSIVNFSYRHKSFYAKLNNQLQQKCDHDRSSGPHSIGTETSQNHLWLKGGKVFYFEYNQMF